MEPICIYVLVDKLNFWWQGSFWHIDRDKSCIAQSNGCLSKGKEYVKTKFSEGTKRLTFF